jgi:hypothetical protein
MAAVLTGLGVAADTVATILLQQPQNNIGGIEIQATLEEVHNAQVEVTDHPVEAGAEITDHSFNRPVEVILRCAWSNSSLDAIEGAVLNLLQNGFSGGGDYVSGVYTQLKALKEARQPFDIVTSLQLYQNMLITGLSITRDVKSSQALMASITCREVILVTTQVAGTPLSNQAFPQSTSNPANVSTQPLIPDAQTTFTPLPGVDYSP